MHFCARALRWSTVLHRCNLLLCVALQRMSDHTVGLERDIGRGKLGSATAALRKITIMLVEQTCLASIRRNNEFPVKESAAY